MSSSFARRLLARRFCPTYHFQLPMQVPAFAVPESSTCPSLLSYVSLLVAHSCPSFSRPRLLISSLCFLLSRHHFVLFLTFYKFYRVLFHLPTHVPVYSNDTQIPAFSKDSRKQQRRLAVSPNMPSILGSKQARIYARQFMSIIMPPPIWNNC